MRNLIALTVLCLAMTLPVHANTIFQDRDDSDSTFSVDKIIRDDSPDQWSYGPPVTDKSKSREERALAKAISAYDPLSATVRFKSMSALPTDQEFELARQTLDPDNRELKQALETLIHHIGDDRPRYVHLLLDAYKRLPESKRLYDNLEAKPGDGHYDTYYGQPYLKSKPHVGQIQKRSSTAQDWNVILVGLAMSASTTSAGLWLRRRREYSQKSSDDCGDRD